MKGRLCAIRMALSEKRLCAIRMALSEKRWFAVGLIVSLITVLAAAVPGSITQPIAMAQLPPVTGGSGTGGSVIGPMGSPALVPALLWHTFLGGSAYDDGWAVAVDGSKNIYVTGKCKATWGSPVRAYRGFEDACVAKLNSSGVLQWNTFLGSATGEDYGRAIAVDVYGSVYVAGDSTDSWGTPVNPHTEQYADAFVAKLNKNGVLQWNTFMGAASNDLAYAIDLDEQRNVYVAGLSNDTWGNPVDPFPSPGISENAFVAKLNNNGVRQWNNFLGEGNQTDYARAIDVEGSVVYVAGHSYATWGTPVRAHSGDWYGDGLVAQLNGSTGARQWHTFLGGTATDEVRGIVVDGSKVYVTGYSYGTWGTPVAPFPGKSDNVFAARLNSSGVLQWNTFMGGGDYEDDKGNAIAVDEDGRVYVAGESRYSWGTPINPHAQKWDAFVVQLNGSGVRQWNTFLGGDYDDYGYAVAVDGSGDVVVAGSSYVEYGDWGTPVSPGAGNYDLFVAKVGEQRIDLSTSAKEVDPTALDPGGPAVQTLHYTISLVNTGNLAASAASLTDNLPAGLSLTSGPTCSGGTCNYHSGSHTITWEGGIDPGASVTISYAGQVSVPANPDGAVVFENTAWVDDGSNPPFSLTAKSAVMHYVYLPLVARSH